MSSRAGWLVMESVAVLGFAAVFFWGARSWSLVPMLLFVMWQLHYVNRAFVYPFRTRSERRIPLIVVGMAIAFNGVNAYLNARWLSHLGAYPTSWLRDPRLWLGLSLFLVGRGVNVRADALLLGLRSEGGYRIPRGGLFRWISCPNYLGEIIEWIGWAVATWSLAGAAFAVFTAANLVPRALAHHRWYRRRFDGYPTERRALVPFLL